MPKQSCVLCTENSGFCVCKECEKSLGVNMHRCQSCAAPLNSDLYFCGACLACAPRYSKVHTLYDYSGSCATLIKQFKFNHQLCIGDFFAHKLYDKYLDIVSRHGEYDAVIPLPLSQERLRERGYNQTHELLRIISKKTNVPIDQTSVRRIKVTRALSTLALEERKIEIKDAFSAKPMAYNKVLLVDDVMTTGASLNELAKVVLKSGVSSCDVLTVARA